MDTDTCIQLMVHTILLYFLLYIDKSFFTWLVVFLLLLGLLLLWHLITVSTHVHLLFILANSCSLVECFTLVFCCSFFCTSVAHSSVKFQMRPTKEKETLHAISYVLSTWSSFYLSQRKFAWCLFQFFFCLLKNPFSRLCSNLW